MTHIRSLLCLAAAERPQIVCLSEIHLWLCKQSMAQPSGSEEGESSTVPRNTPVKGHTDQRTAAVAEASAKLGPNDFECLHVVGQGAFGKVTMSSGTCGA